MTTVVDGAASSLLAMRQLIQGKRPADQISGSVAIVQTASSAASLGMFSLAWFTATLSGSIGMINLLPIVPLDGGNLMLYAIEAVLRRKLTPRAVSRAAFGGMALIDLLMLWGARNDMMHLLARPA